MENLNLKAALLAIALVVFTYSYYVKEPGSIMSPLAFIGLGVIALGMFVAYFFLVKIIGYGINHKIYPNIILNILMPFAVIGVLSWLLYAAIYVKPFGLTRDFTMIVKDFLSTHLLFIAICTTVIGLILSFPLQSEKSAGQPLLRNNLILLSASVLVFVISVFAFYRANLISQPKLDPKYAEYKNLGEQIDSKNYEIALLVVPDERNLVARPYFLPDKKELILITEYKSSNEDAPIEKIYRIDSEGKILESISEAKLTDMKFDRLILRDGLLTDSRGKEVITWIFDRNKNRQPINELVMKDSWKLEALAESPDDLKLVHFNKTNVFHCNDIKTVQYNGTNYYDIIRDKDILKVKIDSIYTHHGGTQNCNEKKLEYYVSDELNFGLLRLSEQAYYIVRPKK